MLTELQPTSNNFGSPSGSENELPPHSNNGGNHIKPYSRFKLDWLNFKLPAPDVPEYDDIFAELHAIGLDKLRADKLNDVLLKADKTYHELKHERNGFISYSDYVNRAADWAESLTLDHFVNEKLELFRQDYMLDMLQLPPQLERTQMIKRVTSRDIIAPIN